MDKLQTLLLAAARPAAPRPIQQPSEFSVERQKLFAEQEARLWQLRKARLDPNRDAESVASTRNYDVVRHRGAWRVLHLGKHSSGHANQQAAIAAAIERAKADTALGRTVRVRLVRTDGRVWPISLTTGTAADPGLTRRFQVP